MTAQTPMNERRKHPRLESNVPVKICLDDGDIVTQTANISRSGAYCRVDKAINVMTKMKVHLLLPIKKNGKIATKKISCQGVIVRNEPIDSENGFNIAIFFNDIATKDADLIADYISAYLEQEHGAKLK